MEIKNKKASFDYEFVSTLVAGISLVGTEVKSLRQGKASLADAFCYIKNGEIWLKNAYIAPYDMNGYRNHEERRERRLLAHKSEIRKMESQTKEKGYTIVPYKLYFDANGRCKVCIAVAKGKKSYDKKQALKEKDIDRQTKREIGL